MVEPSVIVSHCGKGRGGRDSSRIQTEIAFHPMVDFHLTYARSECSEEQPEVTLESVAPRKAATQGFPSVKQKLEGN